MLMISKCSIKPTPAGIKNNGIKFKSGDAQGATWCCLTMPVRSSASNNNIAKIGAGNWPSIKCITNLASAKQLRIMILLMMYLSTSYQRLGGLKITLLSPFALFIALRVFGLSNNLIWLQVSLARIALSLFL